MGRGLHEVVGGDVATPSGLAPPNGWATAAGSGFILGRTADASKQQMRRSERLSNGIQCYRLPTP